MHKSQLLKSFPVLLAPLAHLNNQKIRPLCLPVSELTSHPRTMTPDRQQAHAELSYLSELPCCRDDPELKTVFEDIEASGGRAMEKYWNDHELMTKIAARMQSVSLKGPTAAPDGAKPARKAKHLVDARRTKDQPAAGLSWHVTPAH